MVSKDIHDSHEMKYGYVIVFKSSKKIRMTRYNFKLGIIAGNVVKIELVQA